MSESANPGTKYSIKCSDALWYERSNALSSPKVSRNSRIGTQVTQIPRITRESGNSHFFRLFPDASSHGAAAAAAAAVAAAAVLNSF